MHLIRHIVWLAAVAVLAGCAGATRWEEPVASTPVTGQPTRPVQPAAPSAPGADMTRSARGNPPFYEVFGVRYHVLSTSEGYRERGVASWYGKKFHGRDTSSGERYDMYEMTAAHNTLPLPTNVRVTNLENGRSIVVRVNDRGPFAKNRIIDLSYAAARELDMITNGTALVEVKALDGPYDAPAASQVAASGAVAPNLSSTPASRMYVQVGAFGEATNAQNLASRLSAGGLTDVVVHTTAGEDPTLYRVRIGPFASVDDYDRLLARVQELQLPEARLVVD